MADVPHFSTPFRFVGSSIAVDDQDTVDEIESCVEAALRTEIGSLVDQPEFGTPDVSMLRDMPLGEIAQAVRDSEPRVQVMVQDYPDRFDALVRRVTVSIGQRGEQ